MNGPQNGFGAHTGSADPQKSITRPFTLQEALPYSPQTSTVPFLPDIIPDPSLGSGSPALRISDLFPTEEFDRLNREAASQVQPSRNVKQAVDLVLQDLKPSQRTQYNFRSLPGAPANAHSVRPLIQDLSPVTRAIYDKVGNAFKTTKPHVGSSTHLNGQGKGARVKNEESPYPSLANSQVQNAQAHRSNSHRIDVVIPSKKNIDLSSYVDVTNLPSSVGPLDINPQLLQSQPQPGLPPPQSLPNGLETPLSQAPQAAKESTFRIELSSGNIDRSEYLEVADVPAAPQNLSTRKPERQGFPGSQGLIGSSLDQRQRSEAALDALEKLMRSVFVAAGNALGGEPGYDHLITLTPDREANMTGATQQKMHGAIQKVIGLGCFNQVPVENLIQVLKLSEVTLKQADALEVRIDESWDEAGLESWVQQLPDVDTALKAARTCLRLLSGGREDRQLYSEGIITKSVDLFRSVTEDIITPIVELRSSSPGGDLFKMLLKHKKAVSSTFSCCQKLFSLLAELVSKIELSEAVINTLEYTASRLIFVENAHAEKDSAVGVQKFDGIRSVAMDMLCQIFLTKPEQRQGIIDDILTSLEKLPVGKQGSRHFKLSDGGSIQPVSALLMRLVQASSGRVDRSNQHGRAAIMRDIDGDGGQEEQDGDQEAPTRSHAWTINNEDSGAQQHRVAIQELETAVAPLTETATRNGSYIINFIVKRAMRSTKSGDSPYRLLLDNFVEDFTTCLDSPEWPAAELLLRLLMLMIIQLFEAPKTPAPTKNMALELLGSMIAAICRLRSHVKRIAASFEGSDADELSSYLADLAAHALEQKSQLEHTVAWSGPYRTTLEYLQGRSADDPHLSSAVSFMIADWASRVQAGYDALQEDDNDRDQELGRLAYRLRMMIENRSWLMNEYSFKAVTDNQAKFSYSILVLRSPLCESFNRILNILLGSMSSDQATVRSKSLRSITQVLETDPSILDGGESVIQMIVDCSSDSSAQVRDSALSLLGNCMTMRPALQANLTPKIIERFQDAGPGVRKRAMKLARDIYLRNRSKMLRSAIANGLLRRIQDPEESIRDLARQIIEEVWFAPFYHSESTAVFQTSLTEHVALVIQTVKTGTVTEILDKVFQTILKPGTRALEGPFSVCSKIVASMFGLIDNWESDDPAVPAGRDALQVLTIFAKAEPKLFNFEQIRLLKPQLASFSGADELTAFRAVTVIYKLVLPELPTIHSEFVIDVRRHLQKGIGKISSRGAFDDLIACARVCCDLLKDLVPLASVVASSLMGIEKLPETKLEAKQLNVLSAYAIIVGCVAKHCDLDEQKQIFITRFPKRQVDKVPRLIVDVLSPYTSPKQPLEARRASLEAIGLVCQAWPRNYSIAKVYTAFQQVFHDQEPTLETMVLRSFKEFLVTEEKRSETAAAGAAADKKKELTVMGGTNFDDVASALAQRFLNDIKRIALASQDEHAFLAMEVLGSINRQGLTHPKETGVTLITLETSANRKIAELAFSEHRSLHEKHETVIEREYVKAVQSAYNYQRDIVKDSHGATTDPFQSKLHFLMLVLKISKMKNRQRFLEKLCGQADFDLSKLDDTEGPVQHADFSRFIAENLAFFDYQTVGELQTTVNTIEKIVTSTGATVAQAIESDIFNVRMDIDQLDAAAPAPPTTAGGFEGDLIKDEIPVAAPPLPVDEGRLIQLTAGSIVLLSLWEARTYLRRLYGMGTHRHDSKAKSLAKDLNKAPTRVQGVNGEKFWDEMPAHMNALQSREQMIHKCRALVELMNVDKEFKVADEEDDMALDGPTTPSEGEDDEGGDRGRKRKGGGTPGGRKKRARSSSQPRKRGRHRKHADDDGEDELQLDDEDWV